MRVMRPETGNVLRIIAFVVTSWIILLVGGGRVGAQGPYDLPSKMPAALHPLGQGAAAAVVQMRVPEANLRSVQPGTLRLLPDMLEAVVIHDGVESLSGAGERGGRGPWGAAVHGGAA